MSDNFEIKYLMNAKIELEHRIMKLEEHHVIQIDENRKVSRRIDELEEQMKNQFEKNRLVADLFDEYKKQDSFLFSNIQEVKGWLRMSDLLKKLEKEKKSGLSFEEAVELCIKHKLHRKGWAGSSWSNAYMYMDTVNSRPKIYVDELYKNVYPDRIDILTDDWEIIE